MKYIIYAKLGIDIEADSKEDAVEKATKLFDKLKNDEKVEITEAKVADKATGYFI